MLAAVYDDDRLLPLTLAVAYLPLAFALQAPQWIFFRRMDFVRLRMLQAIVPLGTVVVTVPLASREDAESDHALGLHVVSNYAGDDPVHGLPDDSDQQLELYQSARSNAEG